MSAPKEWSVRNGAFVGCCMVQPDEVSIGGFASKRENREHEWLFFAIDLRQITHLRKYSQEHPEWCDLYNGPNIIATVNAAATDVASEWFKMLHAFERIPSTHEARQGRTLAAIHKEALPSKL